jgi:hypothetical protein
MTASKKMEDDLKKQQKLEDLKKKIEMEDKPINQNRPNWL